MVPPEILRLGLVPGGKLVRFFVSETRCARALLGWSQNTLVYAAGWGASKMAKADLTSTNSTPAGNALVGSDPLIREEQR
jgi:hypothetical protein